MYRAGPGALESWRSQVRTPLWPSSFKETKTYIQTDILLTQRKFLFAIKMIEYNYVQVYIKDG